MNNHDIDKELMNANRIVANGLDRLFTDKGYISKGVKLWSSKCSEWGVWGIYDTAELAEKDRAIGRLSFWLKNEANDGARAGQCLVVVGRNFSRYQNFIYGGLTKEERSTITKCSIGKRERVESQYRFTDLKVLEKVVMNIPNNPNATQATQDTQTDTTGQATQETTATTKKATKTNTEVI